MDLSAYDSIVQTYLIILVECFPQLLQQPSPDYHNVPVHVQSAVNGAKLGCLQNDYSPPD